MLLLLPVISGACFAAGRTVDHPRSLPVGRISVYLPSRLTARAIRATKE